MGGYGKGETLDESIALWEGRDPAELQAPTFAIWPENWDILEVFLAVTTQWRKIIPPMGGRILYDGLRYEGVEAHMRMADVYRRKHVWSHLQQMERAAMEVLNRDDE